MTMPRLVIIILMFISTHLLAQKVDYDKIIPTDASTDTLTVEEKLVQIAWKNHPSSEIALLEVASASAKKKNDLQIASHYA